MTSGSLYNWIKAYGPDSEEHRQSLKQSNRIKQFEKELKRVTMERDILKEATVSSSEIYSQMGCIIREHPVHPRRILGRLLFEERPEINIRRQ